MYSIGERIPGGYVFVDGSSVGEIGPAVLRDREALAHEGFLIVTAAVDSEGRVKGEVKITSRGFVYLRGSDQMIERTKLLVQDTLLKTSHGNREQAVQEAVTKFLQNETKRRPMIFAHIHQC